MINDQLINPSGIAVVGGSDDLMKPGGKILQNIIEGGYSGNLLVVNPKRDLVQGIKSYRDVRDIPPVDLAILAIPSKYCLEAVDVLARQKNVKAFIIISAGFSEISEEGRKLEKDIASVVNDTGGCLIGPNCIGVVTRNYHGVFTTPVPLLSDKGCDFVSGSGATALFIIESALPKGLRFSSVFSVGNSAQTGVEEVLEYWDLNFDPEKSSLIKLIYVESIFNPDKLLQHASSLIRKGCRIAAIKAGTSEAGNRAASSHTGAIATSDSAVEALFRKAGIVRCSGREELTTVGSVFMHKPLNGRNIAIITHAGGPAVMLTDALSSGGMNIPRFSETDQNNILSMMNPGASALNPIDMIATGSVEQLGKVIDYVDRKVDGIDGMSVIFGNNGLNDMTGVYDLLHSKIKECRKPLYPILPSISSSFRELEYFMGMGNVNFPDEVVLGRALTRIYNTPLPAEEKIYLQNVDVPQIRRVIDNSENGYLEPAGIQGLLRAANIPLVREGVAKTKAEVIELAGSIGYPLALKVVGPVHKSDVGGVTLNIKSQRHLEAEFSRMEKIEGVTGVMVQKMLSGTELFIGAKYESRFGHIILCGLGGIFVEVLGDVSSGLAPLTLNEARSMIRSLRAYRIIRGTRGKPGINETLFAEIIVRLSTLLRFATEIKELDLNPLIGSEESVTVVDARIRIEK
ncbi:MAG TPA: acetate--CoA ligase family protein [Bacteroidales bacterium]|jgi:acyl-CoA synthetase (NDP forming)|nr:acetate--CoA ligase family protein [Bacteroidota bacterium]MZP65445.1 CoA-binding protein [Bacteroidales bacterium]NLK53521.1 CoA-binding protein [Bacteroidales bacterium]HNY51934.1 acetate--CoA ligase family protein [Bacteroidales bacterium]HOG55870.1 acetate--CoA ligase family protein [Bacteroidales bacterium]